MWKLTLVSGSFSCIYIYRSLGSCQLCLFPKFCNLAPKRKGTAICTKEFLEKNSMSPYLKFFLKSPYLDKRFWHMTMLQRFKKILLSSLICSHFWPNLHVDDRQSTYLTELKQIQLGKGWKEKREKNQRILELEKCRVWETFGPVALLRNFRRIFYYLFISLFNFGGVGGVGFSRVLVMGVTFPPFFFTERFLGAREEANYERPRFSPPRLWQE
jgi:hypothetical protein